ncbi:hypothetical protein ADUPG1_005753, partial [Aduncisulcus paluster]
GAPCGSLRRLKQKRTFPLTWLSIQEGPFLFLKPLNQDWDTLSEAPDSSGGKTPGCVELS